jgi:hypothetical protein
MTNNIDVANSFAIHRSDEKAQVVCLGFGFDKARVLLCSSFYIVARSIYVINF